MTDRPLPHRQQELFDLLKGRGDVPVLALYRAMNPHDRKRHDDQRWAHHWLGIYVTRANRRLRDRGLKIQPGERRRTYTLTVVA